MARPKKLVKEIDADAPCRCPKALETLGGRCDRCKRRARTVHDPVPGMKYEWTGPTMLASALRQSKRMAE